MERATLIGGGGGLPAIFTGMRALARTLTGIVGVTDDGRDTGVVRAKQKVLAPGDLRNVLAQVATGETWLAELLQYRFEDGSTLGNRLLALGAQLNGGSMEKVILNFSRLFLRPSEIVLTMATEPFDLHIQGLDENGNFYFGEVAVRATNKPRIVKVELNKPSGIHWRAKEAIEQADQTTIVPGSLFSTKASNLLIQGVPQALRRCPQRVLMLNSTTQPGQTDYLDEGGELRFFTPFDEVKFLTDITGPGVIQYVLADSTKVGEEVEAILAAQDRRCLRMTPDEREKIESLLGVRVVLRPLIVPTASDKGEWNKESAILFHDPNASAKALWEIYQEGERVVYSLPTDRKLVEQSVIGA